ncbi:hypothetical protein DM860_016437 [Cuscuta australis]|uniref:CCR4-NOT transcription complex subunit 10 n=1 Tax=Cuscuta australis TaxID=267555 RepID=A0A328DJ52_9ASTE|nr:hypothetical protein DM860_016437 [Cuscuta australis]
MDSSVHPASMAASSNREAAVSAAAALAAAEDDFKLSGLVKESAILFHSGKFKDCIRVLNQLLQKKEGDPKVLHNIVIAENSQDGCTNPKKLVDELKNFKIRRADLVATPGNRVEASTSNATSKAEAAIKGNNSSLNHDSSLRSSQAIFTEESNISIPLYNLAVSWFHLHEYARAFSILDALFQNIQLIDEDTAKHICLLFLDVALLSHNARRSMDVIGYVEKVFCNSSTMNQPVGGNSAPHVSNFVSKPVSGSNHSTISDANNPHDPTVTPKNSESSLAVSLSEEVLDDDSHDTLHLISSIEMNGQNPPARQPSKDLLKNQTDESISIMDMRMKLHLCKVRFLILTRNLKAAKREAKMAMVKDNPMALYLKSQLEYARGNHKKAIRLLTRTETGISSMYYNNLGCIFYRLGKPHISAMFFSKAMSSSSSLRKEKPLNLSSFSRDKSILIMYNCGVQYLACGKPVLAARCFYKSSPMFYNKPLLWLRLAECCLMALEKGLLKPTTSSDKSGFEVHVIGKGKWRHLVIKNGNTVGEEELVVGCGQPNLSMTFARACLLNALHLLNSSEPLNDEENGLRETQVASNVATGELSEQKGVSGQNASPSPLLNSLSEYEEICKKEKQMIEKAILADLSYVELELGSPLEALSTARSLLKHTESFSSKIHTFLGNVYAAEALCLLSRPKEAAEHLLVYLSKGNGVRKPFDQEDVEAWRVEKLVDSEDHSPATETQSPVFLNPEEARGVLYTNLAAMSAVQGDFELAREYAKGALSIMPRSTKANLIAIYVELLGGNMEEALVKLRQCRSARFVQDGFPLNGSSSSSSL